MRKITKEKLVVRIYENRSLLGKAAAETISEKIAELMNTQEYVNIIFASAPSQNEFLANLKEKAIEWNRINAFHMDEYVGIDKDAPQGFGNFLKDRLFDKVSCRDYSKNIPQILFAWE
jgi:glucosamine-6-phosphate deaminase